MKRTNHRKPLKPGDPGYKEAVQKCWEKLAPLARQAQEWLEIDAYVERYKALIAEKGELLEVGMSIVNRLDEMEANLEYGIEADEEEMDTIDRTLGENQARLEAIKEEISKTIMPRLDAFLAKHKVRTVAQTQQSE